MFAASDLIAFGAMKCLRKAGIKDTRREFPWSVLMTSLQLPISVRPSQRCARIPGGRRRRSLKNLLGMINGEPVKSHLLPMSLVVRGSCGGRKS